MPSADDSSDGSPDDQLDPSQVQTDVESFSLLEPIADGFRNYLKGKHRVSAEAL